MRSLRKRPLYSFVAIIILLLCMLPPSMTNGFGNDQGYGHPWITGQALSFLKPELLTHIKEENVAVDQSSRQFTSAYHFDNCRFEEGADTIRSLYTQAVTALNPDQPNPQAASDAFGQLLHPIQDFYAHSNWVEINRDSGQTKLFENTLLAWPRLVPRAIHSGVTLLQGEDADFTNANFRNLTLRPNTPIVDLTRPDGTQSIGLMSGTVPYESDDCADSVAIAHGDLPPTWSTGGLNKDKPDRPGFYEAQALAIRQTTHEWCRLVNLVHTTYPNGGKEKLFDAWVADTPRALAACNPANNVALIIDETGSMTINDPARRRIEAAKLFIDAANIGDRIAVISFDTSARVQAPLTTILSNGDRNTLKQAVDKIGELGTTDINSGLDSGFRTLDAATSEHDHAAGLLLTDGEQNYGPYLNESHQQYKRRGWPVYTIGLGAGVDSALLNRIANETGGTYTESTDASSLTRLYFDISQRLAGGNTSFETDILLYQGQQQQFSFTLPPGQQTASVVATWPGSDVSMRLTSPSGRVIDPSTTGWDTRHAKGAIYELYTLYYPEPGKWKIDVTGIALAAQGEQVEIRAAVQGVSVVRLPLARLDASASPPAPPVQPTVTLVPTPTSTPIGGSTATPTAPTATSVPATPTTTPSTPTSTSIPATCRTSSGTWQNTPFASQTGAFITGFDATPNAAKIDGVIGLSSGAAAGYSDLAAIVRFNPNGFIDARNGSIYDATTKIAYSAGATYHFRLETNLLSHIFNAFVTPPGSSEIILAENFAFRSEQATVASLSNWAVYAASGTHQVCNVGVTPAANLPDLAGNWSGSFSQAGTFSFGVGSDEVVLDGYLEPGTSSTCGGDFQDFGPAMIVGNSFADYWSNGSAQITISGTFNSSSSASGTYRVIDTTPGAQCSLNLTWAATKS